MILFVTGQYAGAQYIHTLIKKWSCYGSPKWRLVATSSSCEYWDKCGVSYETINPESDNAIFSYLDLIKPSLIVVSTSANVLLEYLFITEAKKKNISTASFIDIWSNYRARFQYEGKELYPDHVLTIDDRCAEEMVSTGIPGNIIKIIGQPYLEEVATSIPALGGSVLIVSQPISKHYKQSLGYDENIFWNVCLKSIEELNIQNIYATRHPAEEIDIAPPAVKGVTWAVGKGVADVAACHTVLGMFSMQMIVGYLWGRKVASIQPGSSKDDFSPLSRWGLIPKFENSDEIVEFLNEENNINYDHKFRECFMGSVERLEKFCIGN